MERYVIHVTKECNMACRYCYEEDKKSGHRTWKDTRKLLNEILKVSKEFEIEFLGGEPLLNFPLIKQVVEYLKDKAAVKYYYLTTNGTILTKEIINFLKENENIKVGISIDGTRIMNCFRVMKGEMAKNSYYTVMENFERLKKEVSINRIIAHMVIHHYNVGYLVQGVEHLYGKGFRIIDIGIIEKVMQIDDFYINEFIKQHNILGEKVLKGEFKDCFITTLHGKPNYDDIRTYMRDENGIIVGETYGRVKDIENYKINKGNKQSPIKDLKIKVYKNFQKLKEGV